MIIDTSALLACFDPDEPDHQQVAAVLDHTDEPLVVSPYVVAELDYLVASRLGVVAELAVLAELAGGAWDLPSIDCEGLSDAGAIIERYVDQRVGVADASNVVLAARYRTQTIVTLDRRRFDVLRPLTGGRFTVLPWRSSSRRSRRSTPALASRTVANDGSLRMSSTSASLGDGATELASPHHLAHVEQRARRYDEPERAPARLDQEPQLSTRRVGGGPLRRPFRRQVASSRARRLRI